MTFGNPHLLWLLLVFPPALLVFFWWSRRRHAKLMTRFIQMRLLPGLLVGVSETRQKIRAACLIAAVACLILTLAQPRWGYTWEEVKQKGLDIVVAIDTSKSMLADDIAPNRLARAKLAALDLMQQAKSDRLGLVAFAGGAFLQCPLTIDDSVFRQSVESLDVGTIPEGGTALGQAIETAMSAFKEGDNYKVLVLFSDGEDHDSGALEAAKKAAEAGLRIFTIGIGSADGQILRIRNSNGQTDYVRDANGNAVKSRLNEALLQQIARATPDGFYLPLNSAKAIDVLYQRGLAPLPKSESQEKWVKRAQERYQWPLILAIALLLFEMFFPERKRTRRSSARSSAVSPAAIAMVLLVLFAGIAFGSPSTGLREYNSGKYDAALKDYEQLLQRKEDPRLHFNAGAAAYRQEQFDKAAEHFEQALTSPDLKLQEQAYYNRGNTLYQVGEKTAEPEKKTEAWEQSLKDYESSLKLNPQDADAKFNHEFVKRRLEELKKQQQQQKQSKPDQKKDQDQNQQDQKQQPSPDQKNDQDKNNQQQDGQNQKSDQKPSPPDQKDQSPKPDQQKQQPQANKGDDKKDQSQPDQQKARDERKPDDKSNQQPESAPAYAAGQMTPQQAQQLLDAQKSTERLLPMVRPEKPDPGRAQNLKDW